MPKLRILDFDTECRPLNYLSQDFTNADVTAIAACFSDEPKSMRCWLLGRDTPRAMFAGFRKMYDAADIVTGHYVLMHDLGIINGAMIELGLPPLGEKLVSDTKVHLIKKGKTFSASQENLSEMFGIKVAKIHMNATRWREANRLSPRGLKLTEARCVGDVIQHMALRKVLVARDLLGPPTTWSP